MYDQRDAAVVSPWADFLFEQGVEVVHPVFEGDEAEVREYHEEILRTSDGVVIFVGSGQRALAAPQVPRTAEDRRVRPHEAGAGRGRLPPAAENPGEGALPHARGDRHSTVGWSVA